MKTKNILFPAIALAMLAAPVLAQDYHEYEEEFRGPLTQAATENIRQQNYLKIDLLRAQMEEDLPINLDEIEIAAKNSLKDNQIPMIHQYDLMLLCIETDHSDVLLALLKAGFNPELGQELGLTSFPAKAVENNNLKAFALTYYFGNDKEKEQVSKELEEINPSLLDRFAEFEKKGFELLTNTIRQHSKEILLEGLLKQQPLTKLTTKTNRDPNNVVLIMSMPLLQAGIKIPSVVLTPLQSDSTNQELNEADTIPAATRDVQALPDNPNTTGGEGDIVE